MITLLINFNMGCFEMIMPWKSVILEIWLTLTWDVLKLKHDAVHFRRVKSINFNMGCFEILK